MANEHVTYTVFLLTALSGGDRRIEIQNQDQKNQTIEQQPTKEPAKSNAVSNQQGRNKTIFSQQTVVKSQKAQSLSDRLDSLLARFNISQGTRDDLVSAVEKLQSQPKNTTFNNHLLPPNTSVSTTLPITHSAQNTGSGEYILGELTTTLLLSCQGWIDCNGKRACNSVNGNNSGFHA